MYKPKGCELAISYELFSVTVTVTVTVTIRYNRVCARKTFPSLKKLPFGAKLKWPPASFACLAKRIYLIARPIAHHTLQIIKVCLWRNYRCISNLPFDSLKPFVFVKYGEWAKMATTLISTVKNNDLTSPEITNPHGNSTSSSWLYERVINDSGLILRCYIRVCANEGNHSL